MGVAVVVGVSFCEVGPVPRAFTEVGGLVWAAARVPLWIAWWRASSGVMGELAAGVGASNGTGLASASSMTSFIIVLCTINLKRTKSSRMFPSLDSAKNQKELS